MRQCRQITLHLKRNSYANYFGNDGRIVKGIYLSTNASIVVQLVSKWLNRNFNLPVRGYSLKDSGNGLPGYLRVVLSTFVTTIIKYVCFCRTITTQLLTHFYGGIYIDFIMLSMMFTLNINICL